MPKTLEERFQRLEDIEAIRQLKARYCEACDDDHNAEAISALFVEDGVWTGTGGPPHAEGRAAIREYMNSVRASGRIRNSAHMLMNPVIRVDGEHATGSWRLLMMFTGNAKGGSTQYHRIIGKYEDEFVRREGKWYFQRLHVTVVESGAYAVEESKLGEV